MRLFRLSIHEVIEDSGHPMLLVPSSTGAGKVPARTRRQIVERESPVRDITWGARSIISDWMFIAASCCHGMKCMATGSHKAICVAAKKRSKKPLLVYGLSALDWIRFSALLKSLYA